MKPAALTMWLFLLGHASVAGAAVVAVNERYTTAAEPESNIDSVAVAAATDSRPALLFATAKDTDVIRVFDAGSGEDRGSIGSSGTLPDEFQRPNGIAVVDDLVIVVERDNRRVSVRRLPGLAVIGTFGEAELRYPYGLWVQQLGDGEFRIYVTDAYETADERIPPDGELGERVKHWRVTVQRDGELSARYEGAFGAVTPPGALRVVESIFGDAQHDRLLIAEEDESPDTGLVIKVYDLAGRYADEQLGKGVFRSQAEGIALRACADGSGYWVSTDQADDRTVFHLFDRATLAHVGAFTGARTANTDGIWLASDGVPGFPNGALYAVHDDQAVSAFAWTDIADALDLDACQ